MLLKFNPEFAFELTLSLAQVDTLSWTADMVAVFKKHKTWNGEFATSFLVKRCIL